MKKEEYLSEVTKRIYNESEHRAVYDELGEHIDCKTEELSKRYLSVEAAAEKAVEEMGDTEQVRDDFARIHNDGYNPAFDIVTLFLHMGILAGGWYLMKEFVFNDSGMMSTHLAAVCLALSLMLFDVFMTLKRKLLVATIFSFFRLGATGAFLYIVFVELGKLSDSSLVTVLQDFYSSQIPNHSNYYNRVQIIATLAVIAAVMLCGILISLIIWVKKRLRINNRTDNVVRRKAVGIYRYFAVTLLCFAVFFGVKQLIDRNAYKSEYLHAFETVQQMSKTCQTAEDVTEFIHACDLDFKESRNNSGELTGYSYLSNYTQIECDLTPEPAPSLAEAIDGDTYEIVDNLMASQGVPEDTRELFKIQLNVNQYAVKKGADSFTLKCLWADEEDEKYLADFTPYNANSEEQFNYYKGVIPRSFVFSVDNSPLNEKSCSFTYYIISGNFSYEEKREVVYRTPLYDELNAYSDKLLAVIEKNGDLLPYELAKKTKAKEQVIDYSKDVKRLYKKFGGNSSLYDNIELTQTRYVTKSGMFYALDGKKPPYATVLFADLHNRYFRIGIIGNNSEVHEANEDTRSLSINGYHFDRYGKCYSSAEYVPFYTRDGRKYYFRSVKRSTGDPNIGDIKEKYYTDRQNSWYPESQCFVDEEGYLYFNTDGSLKYDEKGYFKSPSGKRYIKAAETSWYDDGTLAEPQRKTKLQKALSGD